MERKLKRPPILAGSGPEIARQAADETLTMIVGPYELLTKLIAALTVPSIIHRRSLKKRWTRLPADITTCA